MKTPDPYLFGKASLIQDGSDITVIFSGGILEEVLISSMKLKEEEGINCRLLSMHTLKPLDKKAILKACEETKGIITVEENNIIGGLGSAVAEVIQSANVNNKYFKMIGIKDKYSSIVGDQKFLRREYEISSEDIYREIKKACSYI
mgnify:FL=1